jgi:DNA repair exonuclease SbcCD ATPase subunit
MRNERLELLRLRLTNFRAFTGIHEFPLGHITILSGANGLGKTTFFDAIDWALFGERSRLGSTPDAFPNLWEPKQPMVELETTWGALTRNETGATLDGALFRATQLLLDPAVFARGTEAEAALRRLVYLPQQDIRDLVEGDDSARSFLVAALAGVPNAERFARNLHRTLSDIASRHRVSCEQLGRLSERRRELEVQLEEQRQAITQAQALGALDTVSARPDVSSLTVTVLALGQKVDQMRERQLQLRDRLRRL